MNLGRLKYVAVVSGLAVGLSACGAQGVDDEDDAAGVAPAPATDYAAIPTANYTMYDEDIERFLPHYVREDERFLDDSLDYDVNEGLVTVKGELPSEEEFTALQSRIRRVPGVRDLDVRGVRVGAGG